MSMRQVSVQSGRLTTEGDELYYEVRGQGQPQLMIPAAGGDEDFPGHHGSYMELPAEWAAALRDILHKSEGLIP
jgi:hypothetical protein